MTVRAVDVMGFAGGFAVGVRAAGFELVAKREPRAFGGFGVPPWVRNFPIGDVEVSDPEAWSEVEAELVFGCPPCAGFSQLSAANSTIHAQTGKTYRGSDAEINECMGWFADYATRVRPEVAVMESVQGAYKIGREFVEGLFARLGPDYRLTHVLMNGALVGADVVRPRYFMVASRGRFGVGLERTAPRTVREVLADLPAEEEPGDPSWGHVTNGSPSGRRIASAHAYLAERGRAWLPGSRLPDNLEPTDEPPEGWLNAAGEPFSHWRSTDMFSPFKWRPDQPFGVITGGSLDRAVHPLYPRTLTYREAARLVSLPDDFDLEPIVARRAGPELGKAVTGAAAAWIAHWARRSLEGDPGEFAGVEVGDGVRLIDLTNERAAQAAEAVEDGAWWDSSPSRVEDWLMPPRRRPKTWPGARQVEPEVDPPARMRPRTSSKLPAPPRPARSPIERVPPEVFAAHMAKVGVDKKEAARRLGVSVSRVHELVGTSRPNSWLAASRWEDAKACLEDPS